MFGKLQDGIKGLMKKVKIKQLSEKDIDPIISDLKDIMIRNEVSVDTADTLGDVLRDELMNIEHSRFKDAKPMIKEALRNSILRVLDVPEQSKIDLFQKIKEVRDEGKPFIICMLGINGTGKTTTIAKLTKLFLNKGYSVVLAAGDTYRSGAIQQLSEHAKKLKVKMIAHDYGGDPAAVSIDAIDHAEAKNVDIVIIDTAGRMQNNVNLIRELEKIIRITEPNLKIFVGDSLAGNDVIRQADQFNNSVGVDGIIMTKIDSDAKGGGVISVVHTIKKPILYIGNGQSYRDLIDFDPEFIVSQVIPN